MYHPAEAPITASKRVVIACARKRRASKRLKCTCKTCMEASKPEGHTIKKFSEHVLNAREEENCKEDGAEVNRPTVACNARYRNKAVVSGDNDHF